MSGRCTGWVLKHGPRDRAMRAVLITIADAANANGEHSHPGIDTMVDGSLYSRATVGRIARQLREEGWVEVEHEGGGRGVATVYRVVMKPAHSETVSAGIPAHLVTDTCSSETDTCSSPYLETSRNGLYNGKEQPRAREADQEPEPIADFQANLSHLRELRKT